MKKVSLKILLPIVLAVVSIICAMILLAAVVIPKSLEKQAKEAISYEYEYGDSELPERQRKNLLSASVGYVEADQLDDELVYLTETERTVLEWCRGKKTEIGKFYTIKTADRSVVFAVYPSSEDFGNAYDYVLYVDTSAVGAYVSAIVWIFSAVIAVIGAIACIMGLKVGKSVETAQEIRQSFFQNASHELKTPLMAIQGYAEGIQTEVLDAKKSAEIILEESDRMTALVEQLLSLSKIDSAQSIPKLSPYDVREIVDDAVISLAPVFARNGIELHVMKEDSRLIANCDENQLRKAFTNLLSNALRHAESFVKFSCKAESGKIIIVVSDDGGGINEEDLPRVFERFYTGRKGNTGIGLALTKEIIKLHDGEITALNDEKGAVFRIVLPLVKED